MNPSHLREQINRYFDLEELRTLCADLGVDYDSLRGEGKAAQSRELVALMERYGRLDELVQQCAAMRPKVNWGESQQPALPARPLAQQSAALKMARRSLEILEEQVAGFGALHVPAHLKIELEEKRREVAELEGKFGRG